MIRFRSHRVSARVCGVLLPLISWMLAAGLPPAAATIAYINPPGSVGNQEFGGSLGMDFNVTAASGVRLDAIGVFDSGSDGLARAITVAIYDRGTQAPVPGTSITINPGEGALVDGSRFINLGAPVTLPRGFQGSVVAYGYGAGEPNANAPSIGQTTNGGGARIQFAGSSRWGDPATFPANADAGPANRYGAGTFDFSPLPSGPGPALAFEVDAGRAGNQNFGGPLGMDFRVNETIVVSEVGVFDDLSNGIAGLLTTEIWSRGDGGTPEDPADDTGGAVLVSQSFSAAEPGLLAGGHRMKTLDAPLVLTPGDYTIVGHGFSDSDMNGNVGAGLDIGSFTDDLNGTISFVGSSRFGGGAGGTFPETADGGPPNRYIAGTFRYDVIPEPAAGILVSLAAAGLLVLRRRR